MKTANFENDSQNYQGATDLAKMFRGSIHQVLPGQASGKTFGAKHTGQLEVKVGLLDDPEYTYLSFSDNINESGQLH